MRLDQKNYEEEFVINAIAQLATVNARIGQLFNQSEAENYVSETNMHETHTLIATRHCQANKSHINSIYHTLQPLTDNTTVNYSTMNNINENQKARFFRPDKQLRYHWGADDQIMAIINKREKSPESTGLMRRRIELARPGALRPQSNRALARGVYVPRRPEEDERRQVKKIDLQLKRKEEESHTHRRGLVQELWRRDTAKTKKPRSNGQN